MDEVGARSNGLNHMTKRSLVDLYQLKKAELEELKENLGVQLWLEWLKTPTAMSFSEPVYPNEANKQLEDLSPFLQTRGIALNKRVVQFNLRRATKLRLADDGSRLYLYLGSPCSVSPRNVFNLIGELHREKIEHLIMP